MWANKAVNSRRRKPKKSAFGFFPKIIATVVVLTFTTTTLAWSAPTAPQNTNSHAQSTLEDTGKSYPISIPKKLGQIDEVYFPENHDLRLPDLIYIQDCHTSLEAQLNIASIIKYLVKEYGVKTVYEEGFEGVVPSDKLFPIKDKKLKEKVSYFFLDHLRLSGAEYAHINRDKDFNLIGAEDFSLYLKDLERYKQSRKDTRIVDKQLDIIKKTLKQIGERRYPKEIKEYRKLKERFQKKKLSLLDYILNC